MREERVIGTVTTEVRIDPDTGSETQGRISYENRGECFFLPFATSDVEGNVTVAAGDKVSFQMATMARSGNLVARTIRLENPAAPVKYQGVINSIQVWNIKMMDLFEITKYFILVFNTYGLSLYVMVIWDPLWWIFKKYWAT